MTAMETPVETPMETPIETPIETPVETAMETPIETPMESPVETPVETKSHMVIETLKIKLNHHGELIYVKNMRTGAVLLNKRTIEQKIRDDAFGVALDYFSAMTGF